MVAKDEKKPCNSQYKYGASMECYKWKRGEVERAYMVKANMVEADLCCSYSNGLFFISCWYGTVAMQKDLFELLFCVM